MIKSGEYSLHLKKWENNDKSAKDWDEEDYILQPLSSIFLLKKYLFSNLITNYALCKYFTKDFYAYYSYW